MRILITGASGLVGGRLSKYLSRNDMEVVQVSRKKKNFKRILWSSKKNLEAICNDVNVVINCAGYDIHQ